LPPVKEERPRSFVEYVQVIEKYQAASASPLWYRGVDKSGHPLSPSLYRHKSPKTAEAFAMLEGEVISRFTQRSLPYLKQPMSDPWQKLFMMQHFGFPTRLLDWSENPFIGLFFAVMGSGFTATGKAASRTLRFKEDAVVWLLDPVAWNRQALSHFTYSGKIASPGEAALNGYTPPLDTFDDRNTALAMNGAHNSERIVAQRGAFTIFGGSIHSMDRVFNDRGFDEATLVKVVVERAAIPTLRKAILNYGFSEPVVYPGLDGLAKETKRLLGFED
jgi:hypothetical protein